MRTVGLEDISDDAFARESSLVIDMLRTAYPKLDLRKGTVLRDLLVSPDATLSAVARAQIDECRNSTSLKRLSEAEASGKQIDQTDVEAILSNFNMAPVEGTRSVGVVRVSVSDRRAYSVAEGSVFSTIDGIEFESSRKVDTSSGGSDALHEGVSGYWFLVPVSCRSVGMSGNIGQGTSLNPGFSMYGFVSAVAYGQFSGGSDLEPIDRTVSRIRSSLSVRGLSSAPAVEASLRDELDGTGNPVVAVSVCGYGNDAQLRDKHNLFGVGVGGRADVYVRNFTGIPTVSVTRVATSVAGRPGVYSVFLSHDDVPGMYCVRRVSDPETNALSSYRHSERWSSGGLSSTWHDVSRDDGDRETMGTVWRDVDILVEGVDASGPEKELRVEVVALPAISDIQARMDDGFTRSVGSDFVVRCPVVIQVSVSAVARVPSGSSFDREKAVSDICSYVNTSGFVSRVTRSEISSILISNGARSVDLVNDGTMLHGFGYDAYGNMFELSGDALDVSMSRNPHGMVTEDTCVFCVDPSAVQIREIPA